MPYAAPSKLDEEKLKQGDPNISGGQGANFSSGVPGQEGTPKSSGQYANIQSYLEANKPQAEQMGQNVVNKVDESGSKAESALKNYGQSVSAVKAYDPQSTYDNLGSLTDEQKNEYRTQKAGYQGPQSAGQVTGYEDAQKAYNEANSRVNNSKSEQGQSQLLRDVYGRPSYSAGENKLDQVLLQQTPGSKAGLEGVADKYKGLNDMFSAANKYVGDTVQGNIKQGAANKLNVLSKEDQYKHSLVDPIQARADQMNKDNPALYGRLAADASDNVLNDETLGKLGLSPGQRMYGARLGNYLNPNLQNMGVNDAANSDERMKYKALADLVQDPTLNQIGDAGQASNPFGFDKEKMLADIQGQENQFNDAAKNKVFSSQFKDSQGRLLNSASMSAADFLAQNPNYDPNIAGGGSNYNYGDFKDEAPWYANDPSSWIQDPIADTRFQNPTDTGGKTFQPGVQQPVMGDPRDQMAGNYLKNDMYRQIQDYLNSQNYNNVISKG